MTAVNLYLAKECDGRLLVGADVDLAARADERFKSVAERFAGTGSGHLQGFGSILSPAPGRGECSVCIHEPAVTRLHAITESHRPDRLAVRPILPGQRVRPV